MLTALIIFAVSLVVFELAPSRFGVDSRDGADWLNHPTL